MLQHRRTLKHFAKEKEDTKDHHYMIQFMEGDWNRQSDTDFRLWGQKF